MNLYVEKETPGQYGLIDTFINETVTLNTKTIYVQDITAVFKGFTNDFSVQATPNNIKLFGYFGYTEQFQPTRIDKRAKLMLNGELYREGIIKLKNTSWVNGSPSLFELEFSDGQKNLTETFGEDKLSSLSETDGVINWTNKNVQNALQSVQTASGGVRWFVPLVSVDRIFTIDSTPEALQTDNIYYKSDKPILSENVLLTKEIRPAMFMSDILNQVNKKYDIKINPTPYITDKSQLTDLCTMCTGSFSVSEAKAKIVKSTWDIDKFREERFDIVPKPLINAFELRYIGYGTGDNHSSSFWMDIALSKTTASYSVPFGIPVYNFGTESEKSFVYKLEVWEVFESGEKKKKLNYGIISGSESGSSKIRIDIGLDVFTPEGSNIPSTLIKPLIAVFVSADTQAEWNYTNVVFMWATKNWSKAILNQVQPKTQSVSANLFSLLPDMKVIDFVKSIYTMFGYKYFKNGVLNDFYYVPKTIDGISHIGIREENNLTPYADLSKVSKKVNTIYDGYNLKHYTSEYQQNAAFLIANGMEYGQLKYPLTGKPKTEFKIETNFTVPVFNPVQSNADDTVLTFYPFGSDPKLNDIGTRFIYDTITKEFPVFYYNGSVNISIPYAFVDTDAKVLKAISKYHKISHKSNRIKTGTSNYITSLFNIVTGDFIDQNTLYVQAYKVYIENTLSGKKLIHTINLKLPIIEIQKFDNSQDIIIKETKYTVLESDISLEDGKMKLTLLNK